MRVVALLVGTSMLAACGGGGSGGVGSAGSIPAPPDTAAPQVHTFANPTQVRTYRAVGALHNYEYQTIGRVTRDATSGALTGRSFGSTRQLYAGDASTNRDSSISLTYNPRDAIFDLSIGANPSGVTLNQRYQDPAHRTDFGGRQEPQFAVPLLSLPGIQYLQIASGENTANFVNGRLELATTPLRSNTPGIVPDVAATTLRPSTLSSAVELPDFTSTYDRTTFFYQRPGTTTRYVTFAGFLRNVVSAGRTEQTVARTTIDPLTGLPVPVLNADGTPFLDFVSLTTLSRYNLTRGAFVFGEQTVNSSVLRTGTGSFSGSLLASAVLNDRLDNFGDDAPTYFQWIEGRSTVDVNFGANTFNIALDGNVHAPVFDFGTSGNHTIQGGATFAARGSGRIDLVAAGGFLGQFQQAWFINPNNTRFDVQIAGSSVDGAFYGPTAEEVGGNFRIVGGTPDERIDILGVFTGRR